MSIDEAAFERDLKTMSKSDLLKKYPASKLHPDVELMVEVVGEEIGNLRRELGKRLDELEKQIGDSAQDRRSVTLSSRELRIDVERMVSEQGGEIARLRHEIVALKSEVDLLRSAVPPSTIKTKDAARLLREIGEKR
ncbi:hypothetical protein SAMN05428967_3378 [Phyllobacterium sp. YR620]|uniref:hypothetical protein n=1 Tax=Phyllobacterium sp. YR620 TaxID=1881066 RepID=UPI00088C72DD|nr:hypothetical protein [Phyllobacterium sp. YR620]SDP77439.1 hypothetical protein SAMN05428967_3378 [Phyllobacterium sp. YR620]